jgi:hypothetical protein
MHKSLILFSVCFAAASAAASTGAKTDTFTGTWVSHGSEDAGCELNLVQAKDTFQFELECQRGAPSYNSGSIAGIAKLDGRNATFETDEFGPCRLDFEFKDKGLEITQTGSDSDCGFGFGVYANGHYTRSSEKTPVLSED